MSRLFQLIRNIDPSGISGTGIVAEGVVFPNGKVVVCWNGDSSSIVVWNSIEDLQRVSCHNGYTEIMFS